MDQRQGFLRPGAEPLRRNKINLKGGRDTPVSENVELDGTNHPDRVAAEDSEALFETDCPIALRPGLVG